MNAAQPKPALTYDEWVEATKDLRRNLTDEPIGARRASPTAGLLAEAPNIHSILTLKSRAR